MRYKIYAEDSTSIKADVTELEYNGVYKGERYITVKAQSPYPVDFVPGDKLIYHNETFTLRDVSSIKRCHKNNSAANAIEYSGMRFAGAIAELYDIQFCDYVLNDNNLPYTGLGTFSFYVSKISDFGSRIQANLNLNYGEGKWRVEYGTATEINKDKTMSISQDTNVYDAIVQFSNDYDVNFKIEGHTITLGFQQSETSYNFFYGKGHGLKSLEITTDSNQRIVTRLKAYGSQRNLPYMYYSRIQKYYVIYLLGYSVQQPSDSSAFVVHLQASYSAEDSIFKYKVAGSDDRYSVKIKVDGFDTEIKAQAGYAYSHADVTGMLYLSTDYDPSNAQAVTEIIDYLKANGETSPKIYITDGFDVDKAPADSIFVPSDRPNNMSVRNLMLPGFPDESLNKWAERISKEDSDTGRKILALINEGFVFSDNQYYPYIISPNRKEYGMKDGEVIFDGSDEDWDEVFPSLEGMTTTELSTTAGYEGSTTYNDSGDVDRVISSSSIQDNGVSSDGTYEDGSKDTEGNLIYVSFEIDIPNLGFNLWDYIADGETPVIHFKSGMCAGRTFEILRCIPVDADDITKGYRINLQRELDQNTNMYYPNRIYSINMGDYFVLEGIKMPDVYVEAASVRLFFQSIEKLRDIDYKKKTYVPEIDNIFLERNPQYATELREGIKMCISDEDIGGAVAITISQLTIKESEGKIPQYEVTLEDESTAEILNMSLNSAKEEQGQSSGQNIRIIRSTDKTTPTDANVFSAKRALQEFLSKKNDDVANGLLKLMKGAEFGEFIDSMLAGKGTGITADGRIQTDRLEVRGSMTVMDLIINQLQGMEADYSFTEIGKIAQVDDLGESTYKLWIEKRTDYDFVKLQEGDVCYSIVNTLYQGGTDYFTSWMRVITVNMTDNALTVVLYPDGEVPGGRNFAPVAGYNVTRRGYAILPEDGSTNERSQSWILSSREGRIMFLTNVIKPILEDYNYGIVIGKLPDTEALDQIPVAKDDLGIMADVVIARKVYEFDGNGKLITKVVDRGEWSLTVAQSKDPYRYMTHETTNDSTGQRFVTLEQHAVWHLGCKWGCLVDKTVKEPKWNSTDWIMLEGDPNYYLQVESSNGYAFRRSSVDTNLTARIYYGNIEITADIMNTTGVEVEWLRDTGNVGDDNTWQPEYVDGQKNAIHVDNGNEHGIGSGFGVDYMSATFTCSVFIPVGGTQEKKLIQGQIKFA